MMHSCYQNRCTPSYHLHRRYQISLTKVDGYGRNPWVVITEISIYSLIGTCRALGVDARKWMEDVLQRLPEYEQHQRDIADLLPGRWADNQQK